MTPYLLCQFCGGDAFEPDHVARCDGRQGKREAAIGKKKRGSSAIRPPRVIARTGDPETSQDAAEELNRDPDRLTRSIQTVVTLLGQYGPMTDFDIRAHWSEAWDGGFSFTLPCKARHWAREAGLVKWAGRNEPNPTSGYAVRVWELGRDESFLQRVACPVCGKHGYLADLADLADSDPEHADVDARPQAAQTRLSPT